MHFSAKRGLAIACRPSVYPSVTLVDCDHIGWKSWKLIAQTISPTPALFEPKCDPPTPRGTWVNLGETRGGVGKKWRAGEQKRQYVTRKDKRKNYYERPIGTDQCSFEWYHLQPPTASPSPRFGVRNPHSKLQSEIVGKRVHIDK